MKSLYLPEGTKQMSWLSALSATTSPWRRAMARASDFCISPRGKRRTSSCARGGEEEIALVAAYVLCPEERAAVGAVRLGGDVMAGGEKVGAEILHRVEEIGELDLAIAGDAGNRRLAFGIAAGETVDHLFPEALFIIEHVVRNAEL